jgi:hypothetical protein
MEQSSLLDRISQSGCAGVDKYWDEAAGTYDTEI